MTAIQTVASPEDVEKVIRDYFLSSTAYDSMQWMKHKLGEKLDISGKDLELKIEEIRENVILDLMAEAEKLARKGAIDLQRKSPAYLGKHTLAMRIATADVTNVKHDYCWVEIGRKRLDHLYHTASLRPSQ